MVDADLAGDVDGVRGTDHEIAELARRALHEPWFVCHHASQVRVVTAFVPSLFMIPTVGSRYCQAGIAS